MSAHLHICNAKDCNEMVECEDDCVEEEQETLVYCGMHCAPKDWKRGDILVQDELGKAVKV